MSECWSPLRIHTSWRCETGSTSDVFAVSVYVVEPYVALSALLSQMSHSDCSTSGIQRRPIVS